MTNTQITIVGNGIWPDRHLTRDGERAIRSVRQLVTADNRASSLKLFQEIRAGVKGRIEPVGIFSNESVPA